MLSRWTRSRRSSTTSPPSTPPSTRSSPRSTPRAGIAPRRRPGGRSATRSATSPTSTSRPRSPSSIRPPTRPGATRRSPTSRTSTPPVPTARIRADALLERWRAGRAGLLAAFDGVDPKARLPWYGPPMSARSFLTARLMETWAHGVDVTDALGVAPSGVRTSASRRPPRRRHAGVELRRARPRGARRRGLRVVALAVGRHVDLGRCGSRGSGRGRRRSTSASS